MISTISKVFQNSRGTVRHFSSIKIYVIIYMFLLCYCIIYFSIGPQQDLTSSSELKPKAATQTTKTTMAAKTTMAEKTTMATKTMAAKTTMATKPTMAAKATKAIDSSESETIVD